jgi:rhamnose utilization protein RhaD (predicted bifunctional aldolase and dehydrogenase)
MTTEQKIEKLIERYDEEWNKLNQPRRPKLIKNPTPEQAAQREDAMVVYRAKYKEYLEVARGYRERISGIDKEIERLILEESGVLDIPKKYQAKVLEHVYRQSYHNGYMVLYWHLIDLLTVFK